MSVAPITDAEAVLATAIRNALAAVAGTYQGRPQAYYQLAPQGAPLPLVVYQVQSGVIAARERVGARGATADVTIRALATDATAARALLALTVAPMAALAFAGYTVTATYLRSPIIPPDAAGTYQSAHLWRVDIERA